MKRTETTTKGNDNAVLIDEYLQPPALAQQLDVSPRTLHRWHTQRIGPPRTTIGKTILYRRAAVQEWLLSREERRGRR